MALAILLGTAAAGPLYAAFPVAVSLQKKGARLANIVIFLGTWASIKIPMILLESSFIGLRFSLLRLALTVPGVIAMGVVMERALPANVLAAAGRRAKRAEDRSRPGGKDMSVGHKGQQYRHTPGVLHLLLLAQGDAYGANLLGRLEDDLPAFHMDAAIIYRSLQDLEEEGSVEAYWDTGSNGPAR